MKHLIALAFLVLLCACSSAPTATPAPTVDVAAIQTQAALMVFATQTASAPTATNTPSATNTARPTSTPTGTPVPTLRPTDTPTAAGGKWQTQFGTSPLDDSKTVVISLTAENSVHGWLSTSTPELYLRCKEHKTEVYVAVGMQINVEYGLSDQATVQARFDKDQAQALIAGESTDRMALFLPNPTQMISAMLEHNEMLFGFTPFNASPVVTTFDLRGLSTAIQPLEQACGLAQKVTASTPPLLMTSTPEIATPSNQAGGLAMTVVGFSKIQVDYKKPKAGNIFLDVEVVLENISAQPIRVGVQQFDIKDSSGYVYSSASGGSYSPALDPYFGYGDTIAIGDKHRGHVGFEIPEGSKGLIIIYDVAPAGRRYGDDPIIRVPLGELQSN